MDKWRYEILDETMTVIWTGYMEDDYSLEDAQEMEAQALMLSGWSAEEYDETTLAQTGQPGCRLASTRGTN